MQRTKRTTVLPGVFLGFLGLLLIAACASEEDSSMTPSQTISAMLEVAEAGDWEAYVTRFYGELHKAEDQEDIDMLVARFRDRWGEQVVEILRGASTVTPILSEDGRQATFATEMGDFVLHKDDHGSWGFHL